MRSTRELLNDAIQPTYVLRYPVLPRLTAMCRTVMVRLVRHLFASDSYLLGAPGFMYSRVVQARHSPQVVWIEDGNQSFTPQDFFGPIKKRPVYSQLVSLIAGRQHPYSPLFLSTYEALESLGERLPLRWGELNEYLRRRPPHPHLESLRDETILVATNVSSLDRDTQLDLLIKTVERLSITAYFPHRYHDWRVTRQLGALTGVKIGRVELPIELIAMLLGAESHFVLMPSATWNNFKTMRIQGITVSYTQLHIRHWLCTDASPRVATLSAAAEFMRELGVMEMFLGDPDCRQVSLF